MNNESLKASMHKIMRVSRLHRAIFEKRVSALGIHHSQHHLLVHLACCNELPNQKKIAEHLKISPAAVTVSLKKLERAGFVERGASFDARENKIIITQKGKDMVESGKEIFSQIDQSVFSDVSDEELERFNEYLDKIIRNLEKICEE